VLSLGICVGDGVCAGCGGLQVGFPSWGGQVNMVQLGCSSRGVEVGCCGVHSLMEYASQGESTRGGIRYTECY
jgi:hypothetical protein